MPTTRSWPTSGTTLYDFGADLVLNGHAHGYERFPPQTATGVVQSTYGITEIVVGTGGESHQAFNQNQPNTVVKDNVSFGVMKLTLHASSYDWQFIPIPGATLTDSGTGSVHERRRALRRSWTRCR